MVPAVWLLRCRDTVIEVFNAIRGATRNGALSFFSGMIVRPLADCLACRFERSTRDCHQNWLPAWVKFFR